MVGHPESKNEYICKKETSDYKKLYYFGL